MVLKKAFMDAALVPFETAKMVNEAMVLSQQFILIANKNLISDVGCAVYILDAAFEAALLNIRINQKYIDDEKFNRKINKQIYSISKNIKKIKNKITNKIKESM